MTRGKVTAILLGVLLVYSAAHSLHAQTNTGAIAGTVRDVSRGVLSGAEIKVRNVDTGNGRATRSDGTGAYSIGFLPPGPYRIEFSLQGFKTLVRERVTVHVTERHTLDVVLEVATRPQTVTVRAEGSMLQTNTSTLGRVVDSSHILALPLATRNFTQLTALSPGSSIPLPDALAIGNGSQSVYTNGGTQVSNSYIIDGIDVSNSFSGLAEADNGAVGIAVPSVEIIQEFKVQTALYDASFGHKGGANISLVTKTGTSEFHGSLYHFFRNDTLNANNFFLNSLNLPRPVLRQNQFGGIFGGPAVKGRTYFFVSYEGTRQLNGVFSVRTLRLPAIPKVRTPEALGAIFGGQRGFFGGLAVEHDGSNIHPVALNLLNYKLPNGDLLIPSPQREGPGVNYGVSIPTKYDQDQFAINLDHQLTSDNRLAVKFFNATSDQSTPFFGGNLPGPPRQSAPVNRNVSITNIHVLGPKSVNEARLGYTLLDGSDFTEPVLTDKQVGIFRQTQDRIPGLPRISVSGAFAIGPQGIGTDVTTNVYYFADTLSLAKKAKGRHDLRLGVEIRREQHNLREVRLPVGNMNLLSFPDFLLGRPGGPVSAGGNGTRFSNIFGAIIGNGIADRDLRTSDISLFVADDWKVNPQLTLNLGLRWEYLGAFSDIQGRISNFDPRRYTIPPPGGFSSNGFVQPENTEFHVPGTPLVSKTLLDGQDYNNFAPRFGFAYRPWSNKEIVLRGGYGVFYERAHQRPQTVSSGFLGPPLFLLSSAGRQFNSGSSLSDPFLRLPDLDDFPVAFTIPGRGVPVPPTFIFQFMNPDIVTPYSQHYSLNAQVSFAHNYLLEVGYVGSKATHLQNLRSWNQAFLASPEQPVHGETSNSAANMAARLPFVGLSSPLNGMESTGSLNYNSLQASPKISEV